MWPRDAYVGQRVVALHDLYYNGAASLVKGKVYIIHRIDYLNEYDSVYLSLHDNIEFVTLADMVKPVDESRLDVFRAMLKRRGTWGHADNKDLVWTDA